MQYAQFEEQKALAGVLYIARRLQEESPDRRADLYKLLKIFYFADRKHLARYNRAIAGDHYVAMNNGPVPSRIYDMMKFIRGDGYFLGDDSFIRRVKASLRFSDHITVDPLVNPDLDELSETDIECIDEAIQQYCSHSFGQLRQESHDAAFEQADQDDCMNFEDIARAGGASDDMVEYIHNWLENTNFRFAQ
mgnify:FL=1